MTKRAVLFLLILLATSLAAAEVQTLSTTAPGRTIEIGTELDYPPYSFRDKHGIPTGYNADLSRAAAKAVGLNVQFRIGPGDQIRSAMEERKIDAICGMIYSREREKQVIFTQPFTIVHHAIFARNDSPKITSVEELKGKKLIVMRSDIMHDYVKEHSLCDDPILAATISDVLRQLSAGEGDYALVAKLPGIYWMKKLDLTNLKITGPLLLPSKYCFAVHANNYELQGLLNEGLAIITEEGVHREIYEKWFKTLEEEYPHKHFVLKHVLMIVFPLVGLLAISVAWLWTVHRQVRIATTKLRNEIEERRRAEEEITRLAKFPAENPNPVMRVDAKGRLIYANHAAAALLAEWECSIGERVGDPCYPKVIQAMSTGQYEREECNAGEKTFAMSIAPVPDGGYANLYGMDMTDRRKVLEKLKKEISRQKILMDVNMDGIAIINEDHKIVEANRRFAEIHGYTIPETLSLHTWDWQADMSEEVIRSTYTDLTQTFTSFETHHCRKDGTVFPVEVSLSGARIGNEKLVYTVTRDITERKRAENAIRESELKYRTLVEQAGEVVMLHDQDGNILDVNRLASQRLGYTREELLHMNIREIDPEAFQAGRVSLQIWERVFSGERYNFESRHRRKDGSMFPVEVTLGSVNLPIGRAILGLVRDITERKRSEEYIAQLAQMVDIAPSSILIHDEEGHIYYANQRTFDMHGWSQKDFLKLNLHEIDTPESEKQLPVNMKQIKEKGEATFEACHFRKDGSTFPLQVYVKKIKWLGQPAMLSVSTDITERKRAEEELQKFNAELEQRVAQRTAELEKRFNEVEQLNTAMINLSDDLRKTNQSLQRTASGLETANRELESFSYSVSHDLRSPLRAMDGFSQAILEDYGDQLDETGRDYLERIRAASQHMGNLIDAILALSRASRVEMASLEVNLSDLAEQVVGELKHNEPGRRVVIDIAPHLFCRGDANLLRQLLANLLGNAWKFTAPREEAKIELTTLDEEQAAAIDRAEQTVYVVRDNGVGFDMHYVSKLFGAFQRLHSREEFPGTGVGLATVQRIVRRHGGEVWAESVIDQGTSIFFTLGS